jgi:hypothetical protein
VNFFDIKAAGRDNSQLAPWAKMAPTPAGQASVMTQTRNLLLSSSERSSGTCQTIGLRIGVLHARFFILLKHFWCNGDQKKGKFLVQMVCNGPVYTLTFGINHARYSIRPRKRKTSRWSAGSCHARSFAILSESAWTPSLSTLHPRMSRTGPNGSNFLRLIYNRSDFSRSCTHRSFSLCSTTVSVPVIQPCVNSPSDVLSEDPRHSPLERGGTITIPLLEHV